MFKNKKRATFANPKAKSFITAGLSHMPTLLQNSASIAFACFLNTFLVKIGIDIDRCNAAGCCPLKDGLTSMLDNESSNILTIACNRMKGCKKFFSCDSANKGMCHLVKLVSW